MWCLVGLGNPGPRYRRSRHNVGFQIIDLLSEVSGIPIYQGDSLVEWGEGMWCDQRVVLARPLTYMNRSGSGLLSLLGQTAAQAEDLIVIHDDMDLALGRLKFKKRGGDGGHKGIRSILKALGEDHFLRLRFGIGRPPRAVEASEYVLAPFEDDELEVAERGFGLAVNAIRMLIRDGLKAAMNQYHSRLDDHAPCEGNFD